MNAVEESDWLIVPEKAVNEAKAEELLEGRGRTKENAGKARHGIDTERTIRVIGLARVRASGNACPSNIQGGSRMRESRSYGSVRGVLRKKHPYRNSLRKSRTIRMCHGITFKTPISQ